MAEFSLLYNVPDLADEHSSDTPFDRFIRCRRCCTVFNSTNGIEAHKNSCPVLSDPEDSPAPTSNNSSPNRTNNNSIKFIKYRYHAFLDAELSEDYERPRKKLYRKKRWLFSKLYQHKNDKLNNERKERYSYKAIKSKKIEPNSNGLRMIPIEKSNNKDEDNNIVCVHPGCYFVFRSNSSLISHIKRDHVTRYSTMTVEFPTFSHFDDWKSCIVAGSMNVHQINSVNRALTYYYYVCQYRNVHSICVIREKSSDLQKHSCPSKVLVCHKLSGNVIVKYISHVHYNVCSICGKSMFNNYVIPQVNPFNGVQNNYHRAVPSRVTFFQHVINQTFDNLSRNPVMEYNELEHSSEKEVLKESVQAHLDKLKQNISRMSYEQLMNTEITLRKLDYYYSGMNGVNQYQTKATDLSKKRVHETSDDVLKEERQDKIKPSIEGNDSESFTTALTDATKVTEMLYSVGPYPISLLHLKSLDRYISQTECVLLKSVAPDFRKGWLYDSVIDAFLHLICEPHTDVIFSETAISQVIFNNSLHSLKMQLRDKKLDDIETIFVPCNPSHRHWLLLVIKPKLHKIETLDPTTNDSTENEQVLLCIKCMIMVLLNDFGCDVNWIIESPKHVLQKGDCDCGVYVCWYADRILKKENTTSAFNSSKFRKHIYNTIITKHT